MESMTAKELRDLIKDVPEDDPIQVIYESQFEGLTVEDGDVLQVTDKGFKQGVGHVLFVGSDED